MDKRINLTLGQILSTGITLVIAIFAAWISLTGRVKTLEVGTDIRFKQIEKTQARTDGHYERILSDLQDIKITLENKQDRK